MGKTFKCTPNYPVVTTKAGKLRGFELDGVINFLGVKYADAQRFQMPEPPSSWEGVKDAHSIGYICPMPEVDAPDRDLMVPHRFAPQSEHCQYLNLWTPSIDPNGKKPVMVWLHGGGFSTGSSIEQPCYDGDSLSRAGDVVVITLNHRLNILGFLDMSAFGAKYWNSKNVGMADIVAALKWVRENIAQFGGDPDNVTIFGQSGGGGKVSALMQIPEAAELFHKAIVMSGVIDSWTEITPEISLEIVGKLLTELDIPLEKPELLEAVPYRTLIETYKKVSAPFAKNANLGWAPTPNEYYMGDPLQHDYTEKAKTTPLVIGTAFAEFCPNVLAGRDKLPENEKLAQIKSVFGDDAERITELFRAAYPEKDIMDVIYLDGLFRNPTMRYIAKRAKEANAPTYSYIFALDFSLNGSYPAWHCSDLPFVFRNTYTTPVACMGEVSDRLETQVSDAWLSFAKTGDPNNSSIPEWAPCEPEKEYTMIFDRENKLLLNHDKELLEIKRNYIVRPF